LGRGAHLARFERRDARGRRAFCREHARRIVDADSAAAKRGISAAIGDNKVAATALRAAIEMLENDRLLRIDRDIRLPLLAPFGGATSPEIAAEAAQRFAEGFRTFKIKVGKDADADLARVRRTQETLGVRATMRIDANRAYSRADACRFAAAFDPAGIELFEQPCPAEDWSANAAVARVSTVPVMLDEPICSLADVERAPTTAGVGFCKLKLKRFGGLGLLKAAFDRVRERGMESVLGDGLGGEIGCWMEACVASVTIRNAGEFNGFLKPKARLLTEPLRFCSGEMLIPSGFVLAVDHDRLNAHEVATERFASTTARPIRSAPPPWSLRDMRPPRLDLLRGRQDVVIGARTPVRRSP
jgi:L-Ala-D/L-Glu epimerase